jgi:copper(I)-binding protein
MPGSNSVLTTTVLLLALAAAALPLPARTAEPACVPQLREGWLRLPPAPMPMLAGYARIDNDCASAATVVAAESPVFGSVELHESRLVDGVSRMRAVPELRIPPRGRAQLQPGGLHLMLMQPAQPLQAGDSVEVAFTLADGRTVRGSFEVREAGVR